MSIPRKKIAALPIKPGVYQFKDARGNLLYIGKAKSLKKRVSSYFNNKTRKQENNKTNELVKKIKEVEVITTKNEMEALLLEASLIKRNQPPYNIDLKGSSGRYAYLKITAEKHPRVAVARNQSDLRDGKVFGPYTSAAARKQAQYWASAILAAQPGDHWPPPSHLLRQLKAGGLASGKNLTEEELAANRKKAEQFLRGNIQELTSALAQEMKQFSQTIKYEQAKLRRDQLFALAKMGEPQNIDLPKGYDQDVFAYLVTRDGIIVQLFNVKRGVISGRQEFDLTPPLNLPLAKGETLVDIPSLAKGRWRSRRSEDDFSEFLRRYYDRQEIPEEIIVPQKLADQSVLERYLSKLKGKKVKIFIPRQGSKKELLDLLRQNLAISVRVGNAVLSELKKILNLPNIPRVIEMFDISHTAGKEIVASMVQFVDGQPNKSAYRKFKIKTVAGNDDFASMREVVRRRYQRLSEEKKQLPDLIIVDGGRGQLSAAAGILRELKISVPLIALAKKEEEIYLARRRFPLRLSKTSEALKLLQRIRDEAHRFAVSFHRQRRSKAFLNTSPRLPAEYSGKAWG